MKSAGPMPACPKVTSRRLKIDLTRTSMETKRHSSDDVWMRHALKLAEKGIRDVSPNPLVGACIVKDGRLVAEGWHAFYGGPHAEAVALKKAGEKARGATLYVSLEPCSSVGKTPPCVAAILQSGIKRVVAAVRDPDPRHCGRGFSALRRAGIAVRTGVLPAEARQQNRAFFYRIETGFPYVTLKMAQTLDGKIATSSGKSRWISSPSSRRFVQRLRSCHDAVLVGKTTFLKDNPRLTVRGVQRPRDRSKPWRIVMDPQLAGREDAAVFRGGQLTLRAAGWSSVEKWRLRHPRTHRACRMILPVAEHRGKLDFCDLLGKLAKLGVGRLLVEGGGETAWALFQGGWVQEAYWILAPRVFGGSSALTAVEGKGVRIPAEAVQARSMRSWCCGADLIIHTVF